MPVPETPILTDIQIYFLKSLIKNQTPAGYLFKKWHQSSKAVFLALIMTVFY